MRRTIFLFYFIFIYFIIIIIFFLLFLLLAVRDLNGNGVEHIYIGPGTKLLYLGAASGTSVSHCSDIVGPEGAVYAVEFSHHPGRDLVNCAKRRTNIIPIVEDARYPLKYRMLVPMVDTVCLTDFASTSPFRAAGSRS